jgi:UDP-3-O-[3-hydroxymyristoyl] N-acetylglucosamine deacetylase
MVEHLLAATSILGITDLDAAVHGGELPLLDGSSLPYVRALRRAGIVRLAGHITPLTPAAAVVRDRSGCAAAAPARRFTVTVVVGPPASRSWSSSSLTAPEFAAGAAPARTFGPCRAPGRLRLPFAVRLRRGLWFPARQRVPDEPCRHKLLDLLGDLALLGRPLRAQVVALRPSHRLNLALVRILDRQTEKP